MPDSAKQSTNLPKRLDDNQKRAVNFGEGSVLVTAGPGSGKTTVITHRVLNMVEYLNIPPGKIAVITFTKAAAFEMKERFGKLAEEETYPVTFCTFHSFFYHIILSFENQKSLPLITDKEKRLILKQFLKSQNIFCFDNMFLDGILKEISFVKNNSVELKSFKSSKLENEVFCRCFEFYLNSVKLSGKIDYDDMMTRCLEILKANPAVLDWWRDRFDYYLIDEFQDINSLQYEILCLLAVKGNVFAVGDEDQAIYGFRGSSPQFMFKFLEDFRAQRIDLDINYRCDRLIVANANRLIKQNKERFDKTINPQSSKEGNVEIIKFVSDSLMYNDMAFKIKESLKSEKSCVILQRTGRINPEMIRTLNKFEISYSVREKYSSFLDNSFCLDILSYLALGYGDKKCEHLFRIINKPSRYASSAFCAQIKEKSNKNKDYEFDWTSVLHIASSKDYLYSNMFFLRNNLQKISKMRVYEAVKYIRKMIGYDEYLSKTALECKIKLSEINASIDDFEEFVKPVGTYDELLNEIEIIRNLKVVNKTADGHKDIEIMTFHGAKGLEWDCVFLPEVCEGVVPHKKAVSLEETEEERRMFYVAITRARESLWIGTVFNKQLSKFPSPFIR